MSLVPPPQYSEGAPDMEVGQVPSISPAILISSSHPTYIAPSPHLSVCFYLTACLLLISNGYPVGVWQGKTSAAVTVFSSSPDVRK